MKGILFFTKKKRIHQFFNIINGKFIKSAIFHFDTQNQLPEHILGGIFIYSFTHLKLSRAYPFKAACRKKLRHCITI